METNDERDARFDKAFKELKLHACTTQKDRQKILDAIIEHKDVLRGMPTAYIPPLRPGVDHRIPFPNPEAPPPFFQHTDFLLLKSMSARNNWLTY
jgi:hypothetical protein